MAEITNMGTIEQLRLAVADEIMKHADALGIGEVTLTRYNVNGLNSVSFEAVGTKVTADGEAVYSIRGLCVSGNRMTSTSEVKLLKSRAKIQYK